MKRRYPSQPVIAVGTVVMKEDCVLLIKRAKPPKENQWSIPGGAQELGETTRQAAIREVREETAITIDEPVFLDIIDYIDRDKAGRIIHHYTLIDYGANYRAGILSAGDDASHAKWVPIDRLSEYNLWGMTEKIIFQAVEKLKK